MMIKKMELVVPIESYRQMMAYVSLATGEITWFFDVEFEPYLQAFLVGKVYLLHQEATGGSVEMNEDVLSRFMVELMDAGVEQMPRGWGHSHVDMQAYFSNIDEATIDQLTNESFMVSLVMNKKREYEATVKFWYKDFEHRLDLELTVDYSFTQIPEELRLEVEQKVKKIYPNYNYTTNGKHKKNKHKNHGNWIKGKDGLYLPPPKTEVITSFDENGAMDFDVDDNDLSYRLDPAIQAQFDAQEKDKKRFHNYISHNLGRMCRNCAIFEGEHNMSGCNKPDWSTGFYPDDNYDD